LAPQTISPSVNAARILRCIGYPPEGQFQPNMSRIE
jgi:hypothetical protein